MNIRMIDDLYPSMPWDQFDSIVFDVGNVLLTFNPTLILRELVPERPELHDRLMQVIFHSPYWVYQDMGITSTPEAAELMIGTAPELAPYIRPVMDQWIQMKHEIEEGVNTLKACKAHGKKVYVLSNYGDDAFAEAERRHPFFELFDGKVISSRIHLIKPDPAIYQYVTDTYALDPSRTLFIDDSHANIAAAISCGWHGLCFNAPGKLAAFFPAES